jgi:hypothetical protein
MLVMVLHGTEDRDVRAVCHKPKQWLIVETIEPTRSPQRRAGSGMSICRKQTRPFLVELEENR